MQKYVLAKERLFSIDFYLSIHQKIVKVHEAKSDGEREKSVCDAQIQRTPAKK